MARPPPSNTSPSSNTTPAPTRSTTPPAVPRTDIPLTPHPARTQAGGESWTLYVHCKRGLPNQEYVRFTLDRARINSRTLAHIKDQLGYAFRDYIYHKKRCGTDVATLQVIEYNRHAERMLQELEMEKEIRLVLSKEEEETRLVPITPLKPPRQQQEEAEHPFMDDEFDAYKDWLKGLPDDISKKFKDDNRESTITTYHEYLRMKGDIAEIMAFVEQHDTDGIINQEDESSASNTTPILNVPSHARKRKNKGVGDGSTQMKKKGRGPVKGFVAATKRVKNHNRKLTIQFSERLGGPIGPNSRSFVDEIVLNTRKWAPIIGVNSWKDINQNVKEDIAEDMLYDWNFIGIDDEDKKKKKIWDIASERYKGWRSALSSTYKAYNNYGDRIRNKPDELHLVEWHYLQLYFGSEKFKKVSIQNSSNSKRRRTQHLMGSKNSSQCSYEQRDQETGQEPSHLNLWKSTHTRHGRWSNSISAAVYDKAVDKVFEIESDPTRPSLTTAEENIIFQSCYKETTQIKSSKEHGQGYMAKYRTRRELMQENLEVHARAEAAAKERTIAFEAQVAVLKEKLAQEAAEREKEKEENRRKIEEDLENVKMALKEEMKREFLNMLAQHKEGTTMQTNLENNGNITEEDDGNGEHENQKEEAVLQQERVVTVQKDAIPPSRSNKDHNAPKKKLFEEVASDVISKKYTTVHQLQKIATRSQQRNKK